MPIIIIGFSFLLAAIFTSLKKDEKKKIVEKHIPTIETFHAKKRDLQIYLEIFQGSENIKLYMYQSSL